MTGMDPIRHWIAIIFMGVVFFFFCVTSAPVVGETNPLHFSSTSVDVGPESDCFIVCHCFVLCGTESFSV